MLGARVRLTAAMAVVWGGVLVDSSHAHPLLQEGPERPIVASFERFAATTQDDEAKLTEGGLLLLNEMNCTTCHAPPKEWASRLPGRAKISLSGVGSRLDAEAMRAFIGAPQEHKHGTLMPALITKSESGAAELDALVAYLRTLKQAPKKFPKGDAARGMELYHTIGCVACHQPASATEYKPVEATPGAAFASPTHPSVPIRLAGDYDLTSLAAFLKDPLATRKHGRMPSTEMKDQEAADLAAYLHEKREPGPDGKGEAVRVTPDTKMIARGKALFASQRCDACHEVPAAVNPDSKAAKTVLHSPEVAALPLVEVKPGQGCLSQAPQPGVPAFGLSDLQRKAITLALNQVKGNAKPPTLTAAQSSDLFFKRMDCYACHEAKGAGGLEEARAQYFTVIEAAAHSMGEIGRLPPKLDVAGRKLTAAWIEKLLWGSGGGVRPYMTARMPRFGKGNCEGVIPKLQEASRRDTPIEMDTSGLAKHHRSENGRVLMGVGQGGMGCVSCHGLKDRKSLGVPVVNLTFTAARLQPEYFKELLLNPQVTQPGTLMPPLFMGRKKADQEVEMLWTYLKELDQSRLPEGLLQTGDYELKPEKATRPLVFRTFLEGAGMHAVAVGFPQQIHVAFDSLEVRWAIAWKGQFVDAMTTWEERAMTPAKPLGKSVLTLPLRMPLAKLSSASDPWPDACGTKAGYESKGYRISKDGVPTFLYQIGHLTVEDAIRPAADGKSLKRTLTVKGAGEGWYFLGASKNASPQPVVWRDGSASFEETITW